MGRPSVIRALAAALGRLPRSDSLSATVEVAYDSDRH
jgi:hypothetical protein